MKLKKNRSYRYDINRSSSRYEHKIVNINSVLLRRHLYVLSNTWATFETTFIKKLSKTEAELIKNVAYKKACRIVTTWTLFLDIMYS